MFVLQRTSSLYPQCRCLPPLINLLPVSGANNKMSYYYGSGFQYGNNSGQAQPSRYPPWEGDTNRYPDRSIRPLTGQHVPSNFHEYHFRSAYLPGSTSRANTAMVQSTSSSFRMASSRSHAEFGVSEEDTPITRKWEHTGLGTMLKTKKDDPTLIGGGVRFTLMCYNILAQGLLEKHPELYKKCDPDYLSWNIRLALFFQEIERYAPDIVCLQEVDYKQLQKTLEPRFSALGFRGAYKKKTGNKHDGCAIFYRSSRFLLIDRLDVELLQPHVPLLNRDNIGLFVKLEMRNVARRQKIIVGTTHLLFNQKRQDVKLAQAQLLLAEMDRFAFCGFDRDGNTQYHPILMTGDFNCQPYSPVTRLFSEGQLKYLDENGDIIKLLRRKGMNSLIPRHSGISDQCQHYQVLLERYRKWRSLHNNNFELDLKTQEALVNLFPYLESRGYSAVGSANGSEMFIPNDMVSLLSPSADNLSEPPTPSVLDFGDTDSKMLLHAEEKVAMQVSASRTNVVDGDTSKSSSSEQLYFPNHPQLEGYLVNQIIGYGLACDFASGILTHNFNFRDVYGPRLDRQGKDHDSGVTSKQNGWTCVDYIYQSMTWHSTFNKLVEGKLKLIRRLGLFTRKECRKKNIPDEQHPSDHFPLVAEFLLRH